MQEVAIFVCSFCKDTFDCKDAIACHILNTHNSNKTVKRLRERLSKLNKKSLKIKPCIKKDEASSNQRPKVNNHNKEYYCDICCYKTVYRSTYTRHLLKHEKGGRQYKCQYCSYSAVQPHNLKVHLKTVHPFGAIEPVIIDTTKVDISWIYS